MNQFGQRIRQLREQKGYLQWKMAVQLNIDAPMLSKIESGERRAKKEQVVVISKIFMVPEVDLLCLWLADKVFEVIKDEEVALQAIEVAAKELTGNSGKKKSNK